MRASESPMSQPPLEVGVIIGNILDDCDEKAISRGIDLAIHRLSKWLDGFTWKITLHRRPDWGMTTNVEPTHWLQQVAQERDADPWDFGIAITNLDLSGHYRPFAMMALSRPLDAAVISTLRLDPDQSGFKLDDPTRIDCIAWRVCRLLLHAIGHLSGLASTDDPDNLMYRGSSAKELDGEYELTTLQRSALQHFLTGVADERLEEQCEPNRYSRFAFFLRASWINRGDIFRSIIAARPQEFPRRLTRLTTAAVSTVTVMLLTAEAWDLGMSQSARQLLCLFGISLMFTSSYVVFRQRLFVPMTIRITEQQVTAQIASALIVFSGMLTLWCCMLLLSFLASYFLFDIRLIAQWAGENDWHSITKEDDFLSLSQVYLRMSVFVASIGIAIGALGAGFENQAHFRHILFVDEEV